jgi:hypothetical protein
MCDLSCLFKHVAHSCLRRFHRRKLSLPAALLLYLVSLNRSVGSKILIDGAAEDVEHFFAGVRILANQSSGRSLPGAIFTPERKKHSIPQSGTE